MNKKPLYEKILNILKSGREYKIVFIGDSITSGEWVHPNWRDVFEYILKFSFEEFNGDDWWIPEWNLKFFNYSLDGASTREFIEQVSISKQEINPDLFIIMGTGNDIELGIPLKEHLENYEKMFSNIQGKDIIFSPSIYTMDSPKNERYHGDVSEVLKLKGIKNTILVNGFEIFKDYPIQNFYTLGLDMSLDIDPVHPNALGNVYIAKMFLEEVFGIEVNGERYLEDLRTDTVKFPRWK